MNKILLRHVSEGKEYDTLVSPQISLFIFQDSKSEEQEGWKKHLSTLCMICEMTYQLVTFKKI